MNARQACAILLFPLLLGGCFGNSGPQPLPEVPPQPLTEVPQFIIANEPGATGVIADDAFGGEVRVSIDEKFTSASGDLCKRATLLSPSHEAEVVVVCQKADDPDSAWKLMPRVWGRGL